MTSDERKKRSDPSRGGSRRTVIEHDHPGDNPQPEGAPPPPPEPPGIREVIGDAVKLGYNVVEEYLEQGRQAAGRFRAGSYTSADIESDVAALAERLMRTTKDAAVAWLDVVSAAARVASPRPPGGGGGGPISVEVQSARPAHVTLDLRQAPRSFVPTINALHPKHPGTRALTDVKFTLSADRTQATLSITVPDDLPEGTYTGVVTDGTTHEPGGTVCVRVRPKP